MSQRDELLQRIYAAPEDDTSCHVFAGWLTEGGDALGEFIALSLHREAGSLSKRDTARLAGLLKKHRLEWLECLAAVTNSPESSFKRGFLSTWVLRTHAPAAAWAAARHSSLQTVEEIQYLFAHMLHPFCTQPPAWQVHHPTKRVEWRSWPC